jgi:hypothetical protein
MRERSTGMLVSVAPSPVSVHTGLGAVREESEAVGDQPDQRADEQYDGRVQWMGALAGSGRRANSPLRGHGCNATGPMCPTPLSHTEIG